MTVTIRPATSADADSLVEFNRAMAAESEDKALDVDRLRKGVVHLLAHPEDGRAFVAWNGSERIGALMVTLEWSEWRNGRFWWIQSVYVRPEWRRRGAYSALHRHVRDAALADPSACGLRLYVERDNQGAMATYRRLGMTETDYRLYEEEFNRR